MSIVFYDSCLTICNVMSTCIKYKGLDTHQSTCRVSNKLILSGLKTRLDIFYPFRSFERLKERFVTMSACLSGQFLFDLIVIKFFNGFFSDSTADTSIIEDCPDPYAIDTTTSVYPTKGNHSILVKEIHHQR